MAGVDRTRAGPRALIVPESPILAGMYPDPTLCRVGTDVYLATSSFEYSPGVPVWHSRDLLHWRQIGHVVTRDSQMVAGHAGPGGGVWAPTLRHRDGTFWLITTDSSRSPATQMLFRATDPAGPWSDPVEVDLVGIDPDLAWDRDGVALVSYCAWTDDEAGIRQAAVDLETGAVLDEPRWVWHGSGLSNPESPHLYRHGDWWYLMIAEGGTAQGHVVSVARARTPQGPFEGAPHNPIFSRRSTRHPVQNTGHADLVELADGTWAGVYLGVRPRGVTPRFHVNGRETFLTGVEWADGWPRLAPDRYRVPEPDVAFHDNFQGERLHDRWISPGRRLTEMASHTDGGIALRSAPPSTGGPVGLFVRAAGEQWEVDIDLDPRDGAAVAGIRVDDRHWVGLRVDSDGIQAIVHIGDHPVEPARLRTPTDPCRVRLRSEPATTRGPDDLVLAIVAGDSEHALTRVDGRYLSTEVAGGFTGRVIGVWPLAGSPVVHSFSRRARNHR